MTTICRLCLCQPEMTHSLLENRYLTMLEALTAIQIHQNDSSTVACTQCLHEMKQAFRIQQKILKSNKKLCETSHDQVETVKTGQLKTEPLDDSQNFEPTVEECTICAAFIAEDALLEHTKMHIEKSQFCDLCQETFKDMGGYIKHWSEIHGTVESFKCTDCRVSFRYRCIYLMHRNEAHAHVGNAEMELPKEVDEHSEEKGEESVETFGCGICEKRFYTKPQLWAHKTTHIKKKCPICSAEISSCNFRQHVKNHKSGPQVCELCGSILSSLESLRGHMTYTHSTYSRACEECGCVFNKRYCYQLHMKKHKGEKAHVCDSCGKSFYTAYTLNKHIKMAHLKLRPHICTYCQKAFSSRTAMRTHERQHTMETPYKCEVCGEGFRQNVSLRAHRKSKHNILEPKNCECTVCGKKFGSAQAIISHMRLHN